MYISYPTSNLAISWIKADYLESYQRVLGMGSSVRWRGTAYKYPGIRVHITEDLTLTLLHIAVWQCETTEDLGAAYSLGGEKSNSPLKSE